MATSIATFQAILKFCATKNLCKYFRKRYNSEQLKELNNVVKIRGKIRTVKLSQKYFVVRLVLCFPMKHKYPNFMLFVGTFDDILRSETLLYTLFPL